MSTFCLRALLTAAAVILPSLAMAHTGHGDAHGFAHGFAHPLGGMDHVLAMVAVGFLAAQLGRRALWLLPACFVSIMVAGGLAGFAGVGLPFAELGIALSIVVLGSAVAFNLATPVAVATGLVGFFAMFHGYAHGTEMPEAVSGLAYGAGFVTATLLLHLLGIGAALAIRRSAAATGDALVRCVGGATSLAGLAILTGIL